MGGKWVIGGDGMRKEILMQMRPDASQRLGWAGGKQGRSAIGSGVVWESER